MGDEGQGEDCFHLSEEGIKQYVNKQYEADQKSGAIKEKIDMIVKTYAEWDAFMRRRCMCTKSVPLTHKFSSAISVESSGTDSLSMILLLIVMMLFIVWYLSKRFMPARKQKLVKNITELEEIHVD